VLDNVSEQIRECLEAAENCARKAAGFGESLDRFTKNNAKPNIKPSPN
jgi:hypothetical protein